jgi:cellulose synthase/poly-beta-1,6-N-acetylglucosamine synthase-like glycosyltransferase
MIGLTWVCAAVFWLSGLAVVYTFGGYALLLTILARLAHRPVRAAPITPAVTLIISAYDEEAVIAEKLDNALKVDYPRELLEIIVAADGSNDRTCEIVRQYVSRGIRLLHQPERRGKIAAMNRAAPFASGEVLVFSDADAMMQPQSIRALVANLADPQVACVGGVKRIRRDASVQAQGESAYWRYEAYLKKLDSTVNTAIGAIGELFAIRRELWRPMDADLLIEDFVVTMRLVERGWRVVYEPNAITWENASPSLRGEWRRRVRIAAGGFQAIGRLKGMLNPLRGFAAIQYISHKVLRWLSPFFMLAALIANLGLLHLTFYRWLFIAQIAFYALALLGFVLLQFRIRVWLLQIPFYFCFANATMLAGFWRYITGAQPVTWQKAR